MSEGSQINEPTGRAEQLPQECDYDQAICDLGACARCQRVRQRRKAKEQESDREAVSGRAWGLPNLDLADLVRAPLGLVAR